MADHGKQKKTKKGAITLYGKYCGADGVLAEVNMADAKRIVDNGRPWKTKNKEGSYHIVRQIL
jgi:hypothetical protein